MDRDVVVHRGHPDAAGLRIGIVAARFNEAIVDRLVEGAVDELLRCGAEAGDVRVAWAPGSFELPVVLRRLAAGGRFDALIALGAVVRGETPHFDYVAGQVSQGVGAVSREHDMAVTFGILTTDTWDQAVARAGGKLGHKGREAARAAVETARLLQEL